ncbi:TIR domain-containing protein [Bacillus sp. FJAT-26390]|uniref:TIR domain-containing protein n=1 Tax=Bacillus sp. FJAT-26390 TaxID=1743142 RepID=UPI000807CC27|nr:TIR domain-containing protein [Bacillus sp. FJAT-26390]OBZ09132.1 hypothetical protein A7975_23745 [Bacillus sp. FJAT-26390]
MARRVYFAFHYEDVATFRANTVRNSWITKRKSSDIVFFDASLWEEVKKDSPIAIKRLINSGLNNTSVTAILAGSLTYSRPWVRYEILESFKKNNGLLTIHINSITDKYQKTYKQGPNPLEYFYFRINDEKIHLWEYENSEWKYIDWLWKSDVKHDLGYQTEGKFSSIFPQYDWTTNDGYNQFTNWVETAAINAGR